MVCPSQSITGWPMRSLIKADSDFALMIRLRFTIYLIRARSRSRLAQSCHDPLQADSLGHAFLMKRSAAEAQLESLGAAREQL